MRRSIWHDTLKLITDKNPLILTFGNSVNKKFLFLSLIFISSNVISKTHLDQIRHKQEIDAQRQATLDALPVKVGKPTKLIKDMDFQEASHARTYYNIMEEPELVTKCLERMVATGKSPHELKKVRLDLAHAYEQEYKSEKALKVYEEFVNLYPGSSECEEAEYKIIKINFKNSNDYRHDQTKTLEIVELAKKFLEPENNHTTYKKEVEDALKDCYERLCDHDIYIAHHYLTQFGNTEAQRDLNAAKHRIKHCKNNYLPHAPSKQSAVDAVYKKIEKHEPPVIKEDEEDASEQKQEPAIPSKFL